MILLYAYTMCFVIHSLIEGHLGCFHLLVLMDHAFMNTLFKYLFETMRSILWAVYSEVESLDHLVILFLIFFKETKCTF